MAWTALGSLGLVTARVGTAAVFSRLDDDGDGERYWLMSTAEGPDAAVQLDIETATGAAFITV